MSKKQKKPEVGDIWENEDGVRIVFICVNDFYFEYIEHWDILTESFDICRVDSNCFSWKNGRKYIGKSEVNIEDLFKVKK